MLFMRSFKFSSIFLLFFVQDALQQSDSEIYGNCQGSFEPGPGICEKFNFVSSEEAVRRGCVVPTNGTTFYDLSGLPEVQDLDPNTIKMASMMTNVFEDSDTNFAFGYCEDIHDSRGFTSGYVGFTTGTGDAEIILKLYSEKQPGNALEQYLPRCRELSELPHCDRTSRGSTVGLDSFCKSWTKEACEEDGVFAGLQREWVYKTYMIPSARYAAQNGVYSPLGQAIFYDTIIQHGYQYVEPDINLVRVLTLTGPRIRGESEKDFLSRFLTTRRQLQCCYPDRVWPASASRSADLQSLIDNFDENKDLVNPVHLKNFERTISGDEDVTRDSKHCK